MTRIFLALTLSLALGGMASAATDKPAVASSDDPVVASVNGEAVHRSDVIRLYEQLPAQIRQNSDPSLYARLVDHLIEEKLIEEAGYKAGVQNSDDVKRAMHLAEQFAVGRTYLQQVYAQRLPEEQVLAAYKKFVADFKPHDEVRAAHILVGTEAEAKAIIDELNKGGDFAKIAKEKSKDSGSAEHGGELGYFPAEAMVEPFSKAAFAMKKGELTRLPVQTTYGWHVIKVEDRRLSPVPSLAEERPQIEQTLREGIREKLVQELKAGAKIEAFQPDGSPIKAEDKPEKKKK